MILSDDKYSVGFEDRLVSSCLLGPLPSALVDGIGEAIQPLGTLPLESVSILSIARENAYPIRLFTLLLRRFDKTADRLQFLNVATARVTHYHILLSVSDIDEVEPSRKIVCLRISNHD